MKRLMHCVVILAVICAGCYSTARHIANVRPELVKPDSGLKQKYRLGRIVLKKSTFSASVAKAYVDIDIDRRKQLLDEDKKSGPRGTHAADTELVYSHVRDALLKNYPSVFTEDNAARPIAVVVDWATEYKSSPDYSSIFSYWFWPNSAEQESIYYIWITEDGLNKSDEALWADYIASRSSVPGFIGKGSAVRQSEVWETGLLPLGFLPVPGESDWPNTRCFMRSGKDSLVSSPKNTLTSRKCFKDLVFEPKVDGDVLAAAIMRTLNRHCREQEAETIKKGEL